MHRKYNLVGGKMPVNIVVDANATLAELVEAKDKGYMVEETPHVGNLSASTLAMLTLGLKAKLVDVTIGERDNLFYPHCIIAGGKKTVIANAQVMTTHNMIEERTQSVTEFHLSSVAGMGFDAYSHSAWVYERREKIFDLLKAITHTKFLPLWERYVKQSGEVEHRNHPTPQLVDNVHKVTAASNGAGWVMPNPINILLDLVFGARETDKSTIYMLSGQSMYKYIKAHYRTFGPMGQLISNLYDAVAQNGFENLPRELQVRMVPIPIVRHFVSPLSLKNVLDEKLAYYDTMRKANARCGIKYKERTLSHDLMIRLRQKRINRFRNIVDPLSLVCTNSETGQFYSQHDLFADADSMYIPERIMHLPVQTMQDMVLNMGRLRPGP